MFVFAFFAKEDEAVTTFYKFWLRKRSRLPVIWTYVNKFFVFAQAIPVDC